MNNDNKVAGEVIELALPVNPAYVSAARLTASSIANRMNFDIEEIEDIKAAVSEACTFIIRKSGRNDVPGKFSIVFSLDNEDLKIRLLSEVISGEQQAEDNDFGLMMIKALMDDVVISDTLEGAIQIDMKKVKKVLIGF